MRQTVKNRFVIINSFIYLGWIAGIWYFTRGKVGLYKPIAHTELVMMAKELVTKQNPTISKVFFNETALGGRYDKRAVFDLQFGSNKMYGTASFEAELLNNQWVFKRAVADYNVEQRANVQRITKSLLEAN